MINNLTAHSRARRLKMIRLLGGFTQKEFSDKFKININTLQAWESEKTTLTSKGAVKVVDALDNTDLICTVEWLLEGAGGSVTTKTLLINSNDETLNAPPPLENNWNTENNLQQEITTFKQLSADCFVTLIADDSMEPFYKVGDYVGGIFVDKRHYDKYINENCIIVYNKNNYIRKLYKNHKTGNYSISSTNPKTCIADPVLFNIKIDKLAPIIWHRKLIN